MSYLIKKFKEIQQALEEVDQKYGQGSTMAHGMIEEFFYDTGYDYYDPLFDGRPFCKRLVCDQKQCDLNHLDRSIYCMYRYNCSNGLCDKQHYDPRRDSTQCWARSACKNKDCPLVHKCKFNVRCNKSACPEKHDSARNLNICYDDHKCVNGTCELVHTCKTRGCNNPMCKNPHRERTNLKCALGKLCKVQDCEMSHNCGQMDTCNQSTCCLNHNDCRKNVFCPLDSICKARKTGKCELRHSSDTKMQSGKKKTKKVNSRNTAKPANAFAALEFN